jgi:hypothetical protein
MTPTAPDQVTDMTREDFANLDGSGYCLYSPKDKTREIYGLIMYLHGGQLGFEVGAYDPMLQFFAQSGFYVVYPYVKKEDLYPTLARDALGDAIAKIKSAKGVDIQSVAVVGHSHGGAAAVRVAATWRGPPVIKALILHDTSGHECLTADEDPHRPQREQCLVEWDFSLAELKKIPCSTHLLIIQAQSSIFGVNSMMFWKDLGHIAKYTGTSGNAPKRNYLVVPNDLSHLPLFVESTHLTPTVLSKPICDLLSNLAGRKDDDGCYLTSMDAHGYWSPTATAVYEAFTGMRSNHSPYCSSEGTKDICAHTRDMSVWVDGKKATPMMNAADLRLNQTYPDYCAN